MSSPPVAVRLAIALAVPLVLVAACSLPTDERAIPIDRDDLPPELVDTTTTTTTTTVPVGPSTTSPPPATGESVPTTTTTQPAPQVAPVDLFYTIGFSDEVARLTRELPVRTTLLQVIAQLETPLPDVRTFGLRTSVRDGMVLDASIDRGIATVELDPDTVDEMTDANLERAIAQLVLTITSFPTETGGIGRVRFESGGEGLAVFVPSDGGSSEPGEELAFEDFSVLIASDSAPTGSTTTTTDPDDPTPPPTTDEEDPTGVP